MPLPRPHRRFRFFLVAFTFLPGASVVADAAPRAVIVVGLAADDGQAARLQNHARVLRTGFLARGFSPDAITVLGETGTRVRRDDLLAMLTPVTTPDPAGADDETWLVLLGSATTRSGEPSFQVSGPRLSATDLAAAVNALPGRKFVVVATTASGGFLPPLLALPDVEAVAATATSGEINEPRFAEAWAEALVAAPHASFAELASAAAVQVQAFYESHSLAQPEFARLIDRASGRILDAPFTDGALATDSARSADEPSRGLSAAEIEIPRPEGDTEIERRPATDETKALIAEAQDAAVDLDHAALFLRIDTEIEVGRDFRVVERHRTRAFLRTGEALDDLGTLWLPSQPPALLTRLEAVRVITPDGSQVLVNPRAFDARRAADQREADEARQRDQPSGPAAPPLLPLPEVTAGCLIEAAWTVERQASDELPEFTHEWLLAERYPVRALHLSVTTPAEGHWHVFAPNLPEPAAYVGQAVTWKLADLPAFEPRAGDLPARRTVAWVGVSSLRSWDTFAAWYRRLSADSEESGPAVAALADEIARAHPDRAGRLRAAYERVAALRYVAIELGIGAIRPRTPEQVWTQRYGDCKDKAGLLVAVLGKLGIRAEFALVNRFNHTFTDWPAWQFNHALARVPAAPADGQPHDLWLDTTDRLVPFGIVAPGDLGRDALAFNADSGTATFHRISAAQEPANEWREEFRFDDATRTWTLHLSATGSAEVALRHLFAQTPAGLRADRLHTLLGWRAGPVRRVIAGDPYDLRTPFRASIKLAGEPDTLRAFSPQSLAPGLNAFQSRQPAPATAPLLWDDGRIWTLVRSVNGVSTRTEIPGQTDPNAAAASK